MGPAIDTHLVTARLSKDQRNQVIGVLKVGYTVNDIVHNFSCSRQTNYNLMKLYNSTGSVKVFRGINKAFKIRCQKKLTQTVNVS